MKKPNLNFKAKLPSLCLISLLTVMIIAPLIQFTPFISTVKGASWYTLSSEGFETGDLSYWDVVHNETGGFIVTTDSACKRTGTYGLATLNQTSQWMYCYSDSSAVHQKYSVYFNLVNGTYSTSEYSTILEFYTNETNLGVEDHFGGYTGLDESGGTHYLGWLDFWNSTTGQYFNDTDTIALTPNTWNKFTLEWEYHEITKVANCSMYLNETLIYYTGDIAWYFDQVSPYETMNILLAGGFSGTGLMAYDDFTIEVFGYDIFGDYTEDFERPVAWYYYQDSSSAANGTTDIQGVGPYTAEPYEGIASGICNQTYGGYYYLAALGLDNVSAITMNFAARIVSNSSALTDTAEIFTIYHDFTWMCVDIGVHVVNGTRYWGLYWCDSSGGTDAYLVTNQTVSNDWYEFSLVILNPFSGSANSLVGLDVNGSYIDSGLINLDSFGDSFDSLCFITGWNIDLCSGGTCELAFDSIFFEVAPQIGWIWKEESASDEWAAMCRDTFRTSSSTSVNKSSHSLLWLWYGQYGVGEPMGSFGARVPSCTAAGGLVWTTGRLGSTNPNYIYALNYETGEIVYAFGLARGCSNAAYSDGFLYFLSGGHKLICLNASSGVPKWITAYTPEDDPYLIYWTFGYYDHLWDGGTPLIHDGRVFLQVGNYPDGGLHAVNATDGWRLWNKNTDNRFQMRCLVAVGNSLYTITDKYAWGSIFNITSLDTEDGSVKWDSHIGSTTPEPWIALDDTTDHLLIADSDGYIYGYDFYGNQSWKTLLDGRTYYPPAVHQGYGFYATSNGLFCVNLATGTIVWEVEGTESKGSPAIAMDCLYVMVYPYRLNVYDLNGHLLTYDYAISNDYGARSCVCIYQGWVYWGSLMASTLYIPSPPGPGVTPEYYFRSDTYQTLGVSGYGFDADYTNSHITLTYDTPRYFAFRVWLYTSPTASVELTDGTYAVNMQFTGSEVNGTYSCSWECPDTNVILGYQALKIKLYTSTNGLDWASVADYVSPVLITNKIEASTWYFSMALDFEDDDAIYRFGDTYYRSGVSGIDFQTPKESEVQKWRITSGDYAGFVLGAYIDVIGEATYVIILLCFAGVFYFRYKNFGVIIVVFGLFGGAGGLAWFFVPAWAAAVVSGLCIFGASFMVWRLLK